MTFDVINPELNKKYKVEKINENDININKIYLSLKFKFCNTWWMWFAKYWNFRWIY